MMEQVPGNEITVRLRLFTTVVFLWWLRIACVAHVATKFEKSCFRPSYPRYFQLLSRCLAK